jgi:hypothetical protein
MNASPPGGPVSRAGKVREIVAAITRPSIDQYLIGVGSIANLPGDIAIAAVDAGKVLQHGDSGHPFFFGSGAAFFAACIGHSSAVSGGGETGCGVVAAANAQCAVARFHAAASRRVRNI